MKKWNEGINQKSKMVQQKIFKHFRNLEKKVSNYLMIILKLYWKLNTKQCTEKDSKF